MSKKKKSSTSAFNVPGPAPLPTTAQNHTASASATNQALGNHQVSRPKVKMTKGEKRHAKKERAKKKELEEAMKFNRYTWEKASLEGKTRQQWREEVLHRHRQRQKFKQQCEARKMKTLGECEATTATTPAITAPLYQEVQCMGWSDASDSGIDVSQTSDMEMQDLWEGFSPERDVYMTKTEAEEEMSADEMSVVEFFDAEEGARKIEETVDDSPSAVQKFLHLSRGLGTGGATSFEFTTIIDEKEAKVSAWKEARLEADEHNQLQERTTLVQITTW
ncbi:hypothetical protein H2200_010727 [Cladophialophora chaetospira]|uniref:Uncharacterized protein n=1 Tax=Cladophialophora chaetospira TaxID=386627 RepID=A0AA39CDT2_9EURO|nr:hypothetical protein H2200_010727 [Cladophialophora chaetospira]